jgi:hypothetical protein
MDAWEKAQAEADKATSGAGKFVKLSNDGDKVVGTFRGAPYVRKIHWNGERNVPCTGTKDCPECAAGTKLSTRIALNFFVPAEGAMKVIEGGPEWFKMVLALRDKYGLDSRLFEIQRHGAPRDPKTKYTMLPDEPISEALAATIRTTPLHDLANLGTGSADERRPSPAPAGRQAPSAGAKPGALPGCIDIETAQGIADKLRGLSREDIEAFLTAFGVDRVRALKPEDVEDAYAYLAKVQRAREPRGADSYV